MPNAGLGPPDDKHPAATPSRIACATALRQLGHAIVGDGSATTSMLLSLVTWLPTKYVLCDVEM